MFLSLLTTVLKAWKITYCKSLRPNPTGVIHTLSPTEINARFNPAWFNTEPQPAHIEPRVLQIIYSTFIALPLWKLLPGVTLLNLNRSTVQMQLS